MEEKTKDTYRSDPHWLIKELNEILEQGMFKVPVERKEEDD
jgi:hypothetical protein